MAALEVIMSNLIKDARVPVTNSTGGTSVGNPGAGGGNGQTFVYIPPPTTGDKAGVGVLTALVIVATIGVPLWMAS
jgi:mannan endo-1,6-alpha-mannosidase